MSLSAATWAAVTLDCMEPRTVSEFWSKLLEVPARAMDLPGWFRLGPAVAGGPVITFQPVPEEKVGKTRIHLDIWVGDLEAAIRLVRTLGGDTTGETHVYDEGTVVVMFDVEGNEFCIVGPPTAEKAGVHPFADD
jgi:predicted enzyme related to lactoylglutathione lyase